MSTRVDIGSVRGVAGAETFPVRLRRLAKERGYSIERIASEAWDPEVKGTSANLLRKVMRGERALNMPLIEAIARVLEVPPEDFLEYRLAVARSQFDEREVGLDQALENLSRIEAALAAMPDLRERRATEQAAPGRRRPPEGENGARRKR